MAHTRPGASRLRWLLAGACLALIGSFLTLPAHAAVERIQDIDNTLEEFDDGGFQITASAQFPTGTPGEGDQVGAVQLAPIAALRTMSPSTSLPFARTAAGVTAVGRNIFLIGGSDSNGSSVNTVYVSQVNLETGGLGTWNEEHPLPAVQHSDRPGLVGTVANRSRPAVAAYASDQDNGFVYVIGGEVLMGGTTISSYSVLRGTVVNGRITSWNEGEPMPNIPVITGGSSGADGLLGASAFVHKLPNGRVFLYVIGGLQRFKTSAIAPVQENGSPQILYAEINPSTGKFVGDAWNTTQFTIPGTGIPGFDGIWNTTVTGGSFLTADGLANNNAFYVFGGQYSIAPAFTSQIFRADINDDGTLTLSNPSGAGSANASLGAARSGHAAVQFGGTVYVTGGTVTGSPVKSVLGSYVQVDKRFPELGGAGSGTYFISTDTLGVPGMPEVRSGHGAVAIPFPADNPTGAYVYVIGGSAGSQGGPQATVFRSLIGSSTIDEVTYPNEGWYVSEPEAFLFANARLKSIYWSTSLTSGGDIQIQFRVSADADCQALGGRTEAQAPWVDTNPGSVNGDNNFALAPLQANCFQYRARLTPGGGGFDNTTPYLLKLGIVIEVPGATDLTPQAFTTLGSAEVVTGFRIDLRNQNTILPNEPTLATHYGNSGPYSARGGFFVDVYAFPAGAAVPPSFPIPTQPSAYNKIYTEINRDLIGPHPTDPNFTTPNAAFDYQLLNTANWCDRNIESHCSRVEPLQALFPTAGTYTVVVVVDSNDDVNELPDGPDQAESNNVLIVANVVVPEIAPPTGDLSVYLPLVVAP